MLSPQIWSVDVGSGPTQFGTEFLPFTQSSKLSIDRSILRRKRRMAWKAPFSRNLKELRILLCQKSPESAPSRSFVEKNYKEIKTLNPNLPILIRECSGTEPQMWARYDFGVEKGIHLDGLTEQQISQVLQQLAKAGSATKA